MAEGTSTVLPRCNSVLMLVGSLRQRCKFSAGHRGDCWYVSEPKPEEGIMSKHLAVLLIIELDDDATHETTNAAVDKLRTAIEATSGNEIPGGRIVQGWLGIEEYADHAIKLANGEVHL